MLGVRAFGKAFRKGSEKMTSGYILKARLTGFVCGLNRVAQTESSRTQKSVMTE